MEGSKNSRNVHVQIKYFIVFIQKSSNPDYTHTSENN